MVERKADSVAQKAVIDGNQLMYRVVADYPGTISMTIQPYLKDINVYGTVYFCRIFEWQGMLREKFWTSLLEGGFDKFPFKVITLEANNKYMGEIHPFEPLVGTLHFPEISKTSATFEFNFYRLKTKELVSSGTQRVLLADFNNKPVRLPAEIEGALQQYRGK